jgi:hypothetical protein
MRKPHYLCLFLCFVIALIVGCQSTNTARKQPRFQENAGGFADTTARNTYINQRVDELAGKGMTREAAAARASREWFAQAPVASESPTRDELKRREAQADLITYLDKQKNPGSP